ncbi:Protein-disulfide isomerase, DsbA-like protein [Staphylococcus aureus]|uniref:Protein-disulfide isomerase, DsbA-like protein n=1 Tax=Staphylococcus aureus TaxID=1280 RepID=A0A2X2JXD7_STAAU|nr:Protein-disulfide isomerase, DsbA-like protein [Staphylococcus aureus]
MTKKLLTLFIVSMLILTACGKKESATTSSKKRQTISCHIWRL